MLTLALTTGCATEVEVDLDDDADGILTSDEEDMGLDPDDDDSDDDGYGDGIEVRDNTDPLDEESHPYYGGWSVGTCSTSVEAEGNEVGSVAEDFALTDQYDETVHLHDFCDRKIYLEYAAFW